MQITRLPSLALVLVAPVLAPSLTPALTAQDLDLAAVERDMEAHVRLSHFMGSVLIARDGEPVFRQSYGTYLRSAPGRG